MNGTPQWPPASCVIPLLTPGAQAQYQYLTLSTVYVLNDWVNNRKLALLILSLPQRAMSWGCHSHHIIWEWCLLDFWKEQLFLLSCSVLSVGLREFSKQETMKVWTCDSSRNGKKKQVPAWLILGWSGRYTLILLTSPSKILLYFFLIFFRVVL